MEIPIVGKVEAPESRELDPLIVPVAAYTATGKEVIERFAFRPTIPLGAVMRAFEQIQPNGALGNGPILKFLQKCLLPDDRERFLEFLDRDDLEIEAQLIVDIYTAVMEFWAARPTLPRSASASGTPQQKRTSRAAARSKASTSKSSR